MTNPEINSKQDERKVGPEGKKLLEQFKKLAEQLKLQKEEEEARKKRERRRIIRKRGEKEKEKGEVKKIDGVTIIPGGINFENPEPKNPDTDSWRLKGLTIITTDDIVVIRSALFSPGRKGQTSPPKESSVTIHAIARNGYWLSSSKRNAAPYEDRLETGFKTTENGIGEDVITVELQRLLKLTSETFE